MALVRFIGKRTIGNQLTASAYFIIYRESETGQEQLKLNGYIRLDYSHNLFLVLYNWEA